MYDDGDQDEYLQWCEERDDYEERRAEDECPRCKGSGRVTTESYESYLGANYKPCPECGGDPCIGEPPLS